jgi:hypothetical protein
VKAERRPSYTIQRDCLLIDDRIVEKVLEGPNDFSKPTRMAPDKSLD